MSCFDPMPFDWLSPFAAPLEVPHGLPLASAMVILHLAVLLLPGQAS